MLSSLFRNHREKDPTSMYPIAAVVFVKLDTGSGELFLDANPKPYFYLDPFSLEPDQLALVHNGRDFTIVRVVRHVEGSVAAAKATKSLLAPIDYNPQLYRDLKQELRRLQDSATNQALEAQIQAEATSKGAKPKNE